MATQNVPVFNKYLGNGIANQFSIGFPYLDKKYVAVYLYKKETKTEERLSPDRYRFVNEMTLEFPVLPSDEILGEGDILTIQRETELGSTYEFDNQRRLFPVEAMNADDLGFQQIQELARDMKRAVKVPPTGVETGEEFYYEFVEQVKRTEENANKAGVSADNAEASAVRSEESAQRAIEVVNGFDAHAEEAKNNFDVNALTLTAKYDNNALAKTNEFNANAQTMTDGYNQNAMLKIDDFDAHVMTKEMEFDDNAAAKQEQVDASAEEARKWAVGTLVERPEGSSQHWSDVSKYWAEQATAGQLQSDWNQNDMLAPDYIKNKPDVMVLDVDQDVNSSKTFLKDQAINSPDLDIRTDRSKRGNGLIFTDKNGTQTAGIGVYVNNNQSPECRLIVSNGTQSAFAGLGVTTDGQGFFEVPTPSADSNNRDAVNSEWVNEKLAKLPKGAYGVKGDYSTKYGIVEAPSEIIKTSVGSKDIIIKAGLQLLTPTDESIVTVASDIKYTVQATDKSTIFIADGFALEAEDVFYQEEEPTNGTKTYIAWFNPKLNEWKFKSNDTGNVWRIAKATPIADVLVSGANITRIDYVGYIVLNKPVPEGSIDQNTGKPLYDWVGTTAEYEAQDVANLHPDWLCYITDDVVSENYATKTDLESKANTNADNFTSVGKSNISSLGMPSEKYIDLTAGASGSTYTAPANGWVYVYGFCTSGSHFITLVSKVASEIHRGYENNHNIATYIPVLKNDTITLFYNLNKIEQFRFIYAEGGK